jgi:hypothetical protein
MVTHEPGETGIDHRLTHRLQHMDEIDRGPIVLGDDPRPVRHPTSHRSEVDSRYEGSRHP